MTFKAKLLALGLIKILASDIKIELFKSVLLPLH